jgi:hypothetical protein
VYLLNLFTTAGIALVFGAILGPFGILLASLAVAGLQIDRARNYFASAIKKELVKRMPEVAQEQWQPIYSAV